jgi:hypothetical protein
VFHKSPSTNKEILLHGCLFKNRIVVGTIHLPKNTAQGYYLSSKGYTIREDNHSHPGGTEKTSPGDEQVAKIILEKNRKASLNIYIPQKKKYIPYNAGGVITK